jgi:dipeptide/tripeptide permease
MIGLKVTPLRKIGAGLILTALSFVLISMIQGWIDPQMASMNAFMDTMNALPEADKANMVQQWMSANPGSTIDFKKLLETDLLQNYLHQNGGINISWQILAFVILTAGEVLISITCLEYAYTQSPPSMKSTIMACYLLSVTLGNVLVSVIQTNIKNKGFFAQFEGADFFWLFTGICFATAVVFMFVSPFIKERSYIVSDND